MPPLNTANLPIVAFPGPPPRRPLDRITEPPLGTAREPAPRLVQSVGTCTHRHQEAHAGCWHCLDCPAMLGYIGSICSPWRPGLLTGARG